MTLESDVLTMTLVRDTSPQASLFLKNTLTSQSVLFKVKSTMPSRFYVQPSMRVIDPGCTEEYPFKTKFHQGARKPCYRVKECAESLAKMHEQMGKGIQCKSILSKQESPTTAASAVLLDLDEELPGGLKVQVIS